MLCMAAQTVAGVGQGLKGMKVGGLRRLYIPGKLSYPKGFASEPGRSDLQCSLSVNTSSQASSILLWKSIKAGIDVLQK